jgi:hypothetical protein
MKVLMFLFFLNSVSFAQSMGQGGGNGGGGTSVAPKIDLTCSFSVADSWGAIVAEKLNHKVTTQMEVNASPTPWEAIEMGSYKVGFKLVGDTKLKDKYIASYSFEDGSQRFNAIATTRLSGNGEFEILLINNFDNGIRFSVSCHNI